MWGRNAPSVLLVLGGRKGLGWGGEAEVLGGTPRASPPCSFQNH